MGERIDKWQADIFVKQGYMNIDDSNFEYDLTDHIKHAKCTSWQLKWALPSTVLAPFKRLSSRYIKDLSSITIDRRIYEEGYEIDCKEASIEHTWDGD